MLVAKLESIARVLTHPDGWPPGHFIFNLEAVADGETSGGSGSSSSMIFSASSPHDRARWVAALTGHSPVALHDFKSKPVTAGLARAAASSQQAAQESVPSYARNESDLASDSGFTPRPRGSSGRLC